MITVFQKNDYLVMFIGKAVISVIMMIIFTATYETHYCSNKFTVDKVKCHTFNKKCCTI